MGDSEIHESIHNMGENRGLFKGNHKFLDFDRKNNLKSPQFFVNLMKFCLLLAVEKVLMARKFLGPSAELYGLRRQSQLVHGRFDSNLSGVNGEDSIDELKGNEMICGKSDQPLLQSMDFNENYVDNTSTMVNCSSTSCDEFPFNVLAFLAQKSMLNLVVRFGWGLFWATYVWFLLVGLLVSGFVIGSFAMKRLVEEPIQATENLNFDYTKTTPVAFVPIMSSHRFGISSSLMPKNSENGEEHVGNRVIPYNHKLKLTVTLALPESDYNLKLGVFQAQKSMLNLVVRFGWGLFWATYVWFLLVGLLVSGFVIGSFAMKRLVEEPIQATENLNFDYTKTTPVAFVPIMSSHRFGISSSLMPKNSENGEEHVGNRVIPYNHKLKLTVTLALPESDYNLKLGVFQVRVDFLAANGKTTASSSSPCMLRFKSQPIRYVETIVKGVPLVAGFQSEVQHLDIKFGDFTEGYEPTTFLKVVLEQRAEYQSGAGLPEIYSASLSLESELPQVKRIIWDWRRTIFVWISIISFLTELLVVLIFCRPIVLPRGRLRVTGTKTDSQQYKISLNKNI
ncbi:unnamed protein product [Ilex paraguariensis]|uniref:Seipin n=1 Tax=Ilex paraguariensis TaxID=185542 RepID=A0ABC8S466_9AQUA